MSLGKDARKLWLPLALLLAAGAIVAAFTLPPPRSVGIVDHPAQQGAGTEPAFDWNRPLPDGVPRSTVQGASADVPFSLLVPNDVGDPVSVFVSDPDSNAPSSREVAVVYDSATFGRFVVFEDFIPSLTQAALETRVDLNDPPSPPPGETTFTSALFSLVVIRGDVTAVLEVGKTPSADGTAPNSIEWLNDGVNITIMGPEATFTPEVAVAVANAI